MHQSPSDHRDRLPIGTLVGAALATLAITAAADAQTVQSGHKDTLIEATKSWNGKPYTGYPKGQPELTQIRLTIEPHSALPWHTHPYPNVGYVLKGALTIHDKASGKTETFHEGQSFAESVDDAHRGEAGNEETVVLLTYAGTPGTPPTIPLPGQKPEY
jgi:quercetin dioxygenase-like cupin family protein